MKKRKIIKKNSTITYFGSCEGKQEKKYFDHLQSLINNHPKCKTKICFKLSDANGGDPLEVSYKSDKSGILLENSAKSSLKREKKFVAIFDYDGKHAKFESAIKFCEKNGIVTAYSNYCFDLWILLHFKDFNSTVINGNEYCLYIRNSCSIPDTYDNLKSEDCIKCILNQISVDNVIEAVSRARTIEKNNIDSLKSGFAINGSLHYYNPHLKIYSFIENVLKESGIIF